MMHDSGLLGNLPGKLLLSLCMLLALAAPNAHGNTLAGSAAPAPRLLLANAIGPHIDPKLYLVSEKYDGVRAYWDGKTLRFRSGRQIPAPAWFVQRLPSHALDGELWLGRRQFDALSSVVRSEPANDADWRRLRFMVFELPDAPGSFAERALQIDKIVLAAAWPQLQAVKQRRVSNHAELQHLFQQTVRAGGEGLMLHLASAPYTTGRSDALIKLKPQLDSEGVVIGHRPGRGKYVGMLGALQLQTADGKRFWVGTGFSDAQRRDPPAIGSTVTYRYRELTPSGLPRFSSFLRVREAY